MDKIYVVFWTQGGNTQAMAEAIGEGIREAGKEAEVVFVTGANLDELKVVGSRNLTNTSENHAKTLQNPPKPGKNAPCFRYTSSLYSRLAQRLLG